MNVHPKKVVRETFLVKADSIGCTPFVFYNRVNAYDMYDRLRRVDPSATIEEQLK